MASPRRKRQSEANAIDFTQFIQEVRENFSREAMGFVILVLGGYFGLTLIASGHDAWLVHMAGWTAWPLALALLLLGGLLMVGPRAGYWNPEALIGGELLLLGLEAGTFVWQNESAHWIPPQSGQNGGLIGWGLGNLLVDTLGQWPAAVLVGIAILAGVFMLFRHTPLIYLTPYLQRFFPALYTLGEEMVSWRWRRTPPNASPSPSVEPAEADAEPDSTANRAAPADVQPSPKESQSASTPAARKRPQRKSNGTSKKANPKSKPARSADELPPRDLLLADSGRYGNKDTDALAQLIVRTLDDFNVPVEVVSVESGPTVTQFGVQPQYVERAGQRRKVRVNRIVNLSDDLALALAAPAVRIEAPVPGRPYVGIEVPNAEATLVSMRSILDSPEMKRKGGELPLALGRDTSGTPIVTDLTRAPHLLIAGATGSGKSVCINAIVTSLLMHHGPETLNFVMVDPKMVELPGYNGIPHMLGKVITEMDQVVGALTWLLIQMDDRYQMFREAGARNITAYNALARKKKDLAPLPYIVLVVDELADLMMTAPEEIERQICRLAQMARATGIHLILATQRPSTDVVTGLIKANFPTRIAFAVTSQVDSRVILDTPGAEKLLGRGDMLFMRPDVAKLQRVQGCFVSDEEINGVVAFWKKQIASENPDGPRARVAPWNGLLDRMDDEDELLLDAIDIIRGMESCSTSLLQRKLRVGYPKAARIMEQLEAKGVVGPDMGGGQGRQVLLNDDEDEETDEAEEA